MISQPLSTSTLIAAFTELQLSLEWCLGVGGVDPILGGGANLSLHPLAGRGMARLRVPTPHPGSRRAPCQAQLPGCYSKCLLLVALWRGSGVLALKYIGLYVKTYYFPLSRFCFSLKEISMSRAGLAHVIPQGKPSVAPHCPKKTVQAQEWPQGLLGLAQAKLSQLGTLHPSSGHTNRNVPTSLFCLEPQACSIFCLEHSPSL